LAHLYFSKCGKIVSKSPTSVEQYLYNALWNAACILVSQPTSITLRISLNIVVIVSNI